MFCYHVFFSQSASSLKVRLTKHNMAVPKPVGQLGDPSINISNDPRANAANVEMLKLLGMAGKAQSYGLTRQSPREDLMNALKTANAQYSKLLNMPQLFELPDDDVARKVTVEQKVIQDGDGGDMKIWITRPAGSEGKVLPAVIYYHGGGMAVIPTDCAPLHLMCRDVATSGPGAVAILVDFRNSYDDLNHKLRPFPTGLNDCVAAAEWIHAHKKEIGISNIITFGESGGANLAIATAMKLIQDGKPEVVSGISALCPYIYGSWDYFNTSPQRMADELPSQFENDGYFVSAADFQLMAWAYDPEDQHRHNPLAWPYQASDEELAKLPPLSVVVDELDPLRDEGKIFAQRAGKVGVKTVAKMHLGTTHGAASLWRRNLWDLRMSTFAEIVRFAYTVASDTASGARS